jgi:heptosyltransferase I
LKKICILRLSAIGDVCHAAALVTRLRRARPDWSLTWIIGSTEYGLVKNISGVRFLVFDKSHKRQGEKTLKDQLRQEFFDTLLLMQVSFRANWLSRIIKAKARLGFDRGRAKEGHSFFINQSISAQKEPHVLEGFMAFADALGVPQTPLSWDIPIDQEALDWAQKQKNTYGPFVLLAPSGSRREKNWLPERYASITRYLKDQGWPVILCGGPDPLSQKTAEAILGEKASIAANLTGQTNLQQLFALTQQASLVVAPDSGPAHLATAAGTPVISLFAHSNPRRCAPFRDRHRVVYVYEEAVVEQFGQPWQHLRWGTRTKGDHLMARITTKAVVQRLEEWLGEFSNLRPQSDSIPNTPQSL